MEVAEARERAMWHEAMSRRSFEEVQELQVRLLSRCTPSFCVSSTATSAEVCLRGVSLKERMAHANAGWRGSPLEGRVAYVEACVGGRKETA